MGFVLSPEEAQALIERDPRNRDVLFPYLNGEDLNSRPDQSPSRWVINFHDWPLERAETYPDCMKIVREKVKPERDRVNQRNAREKWWLFERARPELYTTIAGMERVLVRARVSEHHQLVFTPANQVMSEATVIFPFQEGASFAILQSRMRYAPSDCAETFPLPAGNSVLAAVGDSYHSHRLTMTLAREEGLTKIYNRFHDPGETPTDIAKLRDLHVEMDRDVADAYGWTDLDLGHGFHETKQGLRFAISEGARREVLGRLLALNHERYEEEVRQGLHSKGGSGKARRKQTANGTLPLFGQEAS
jgi:hypothetical protein